MSEAPQPLTPPECDLEGFAFMPLDVHRLLKSDTWIAAAEVPFLGHALISLWAESWRQVPAASLPDIDSTLRRLSMIQGKWPKVREAALSGWIKCNDGRLYHPVVAEKALEAWLEKLAQRISSGAGNAKRWGTEFDPAPIEMQMSQARMLLMSINPQSRALTKKRTSGAKPASPQDSRPDPDGIPDSVRTGSQGTGTGTENKYSVPNGTGGTPPGKPVDKLTKDELWSAGKDVIERSGTPRGQCFSIVNKFVQDYGDEIVIEAMRSMVKKQPLEPESWLAAECLRLSGYRVKVPDRWWVNNAGIEAKGKSMDMHFEHSSNPMAWLNFTARVWIAAGEGPWVNENDRTLHAEYRRLLALKVEADAQASGVPA